MVENEYNRGKVDNEYDFCAITDKEVKVQLEKLFMRKRVSYFLRWDKPGFFSRLFMSGREEIIFCINSMDIERAEEALKELDYAENEIRLIKSKSNNRQGY